MKSSLLAASTSFGWLFAGAHGQAGVTTNCPLQGQLFPAPQDPANTASFQSFHSSFNSSVAELLATGLDNQNTSFSVQVFTGFNDNTLIDYHYAAPGLQDALTGGVLDKDTMYRVGSCTKLFTAYAWLVTSGFSTFEDPITKYIPELAAISSTTNTDDTDIDNISWHDITIGGLLSHLAGTPRDFAFEDFSNMAAVIPETYGFPTLNSSEIPSCGVGNDLPLCSRDEFFDHMKNYHPVFQPFSRTIYSNVAFMLVGYALENVTGISFEAAFNESIVDPLGLKRTFLSLPSDLSNAVIPPGDDTLQVMFYLDGGNTAPAASLYTTPSEMASLGRSILKSTLLSKRDTRRWLRPQSFTSKNDLFIGSPWEIYRYELPFTANTSNTRLLDWYTKRGDIGMYSALIALDVEHNVGFSVMAAGNTTEDIIIALGSMLSESLAVVFEEAAREEAGKVFVGTYSSADGSSNITISLEDDSPGLGVASWFNNGVDILQSLTTLKQVSSRANLRLYPTSLGTGTSVGFRTAIEFLPTTLETGLLEANCFTWAYTDAYVYGETGFDEFIFKLGCEGHATAIVPRSMRATLSRVR